MQNFAPSGLSESHFEQRNGSSPAETDCTSIATTNSAWQGSLRRSGVVASLGGASQNVPRKASTCAYSSVRPCRRASASRSRVAESEWAKLDEYQIRTLNMLERASHLLVEGGAGSGKTLIAREAARRFAYNGVKVLLICFTNALATWLQKSIDSPKIQVWALGKLALEHARICRMDPTEPTAPPAGSRNVDRGAISEAEGLRGGGQLDPMLSSDRSQIGTGSFEFISLRQAVLVSGDSPLSWPK
jgi:hypothetical protein